MAARPESDAATLALAEALIARPSVTPEDAGCLDLIGERLAALGFRLEWLPFGEVRNLWARRGTDGPLFAFAGHTDVVPTGPEHHWATPPFEPTVREGFLHGRGAADMKGSLAAMVTACERFLAEHPDAPSSLAFLLTSDEEGPATEGTVKVMEWLRERGEVPDWCVVGEPSSRERVGDVLKVGRRGSLNGTLRVHGIQGHVAYPHLADNPVHRAAPALAELAGTAWDAGNDFFPPTTFQVSNIAAGTGATNVIPGHLEVRFNFRFSSETTPEALQARVTDLLDRHGLRYDLAWTLSGQPFLTQSGPLLAAARDAVRAETGLEPELSTSGGTSDGRFIAPYGVEVLELGPVNATIHQVDERVRVADLATLSRLYQRVLTTLFAA